MPGVSVCPPRAVATVVGVSARIVVYAARADSLAVLTTAVSRDVPVQPTRAQRLLSPLTTPGGNPVAAVPG